MENITKYKAEDGHEFTLKADCIKHEELCEEVKLTMARLSEKPSSCNFANGDGFILQNEDTFIKVRESILKIGQRYTDHKWLQESIDKGLEVDPSWAGRIIGECCPDVIYKAWYRISCTTNDFKEFGQPYYRANPDQAKDICLNQ